MDHRKWSWKKQGSRAGKDLKKSVQKTDAHTHTHTHTHTHEYDGGQNISKPILANRVESQIMLMALYIYRYIHESHGKDIYTYPGIGNGNPLQYSGLENPMDRKAWKTTDYGVAKSWTL